MKTDPSSPGLRPGCSRLVARLLFVCIFAPAKDRRKCNSTVEIFRFGGGGGGGGVGVGYWVSGLFTEFPWWLTEFDWAAPALYPVLRGFKRVYQKFFLNFYPKPKLVLQDCAFAFLGAFRRVSMAIYRVWLTVNGSICFKTRVQLKPVEASFFPPRLIGFLDSQHFSLNFTAIRLFCLCLPNFKGLYPVFPQFDIYWVFSTFNWISPQFVYVVCVYLILKDSTQFSLSLTYFYLIYCILLGVPFFNGFHWTEGKVP